MTTVVTTQLSGWFETNSEGISTIYLSITDEGMVTGTADTPANTAYRPRVLNPDQFSIKRSPQVWPYGQTTSQGAAFGQLQIDNYDGAFDFLVSADLRDTVVVISLPAAGSLLTGTAIASAPLIATGVLDTVSSNGEDVIVVNFKDTIARLDKPLPCRFNPPFVDPAAANQMVPLSFGAFRNVAPLLIDSPNRLYQLHDHAVASVSLVQDKAAPLDPSASPPQYTPALSNSGIQLAVLPQGKLTVEGSSVGLQNSIPGINDILAGNGAFPGNYSGQAGTASTTNGAITGVNPYTIPMANTTGFVAGNAIFVFNGANSIYGTIATVNVNTSLVTNAGATLVGSAASITSGSTIWVAGAPASWAWSAGAGSTISKLVNPPYGFLGTNNGANLFSTTIFNSGGSSYGEYLSTPTAILNPGITYRLTFGIYNIQSAQPAIIGGMRGGVLVATALSNNAQDYITGIYQPLTGTAFQTQNYALEFTIPAGSARKLYFMVTPSANTTPSVPIGTCLATIFNIKLEQLGHFVSQPLSAITMSDYFTEILVNRAGEVTTIFNSTDTGALATRDVATTDSTVSPPITYAAGTAIPFGCHFDSPPSILDALRMPLDAFRACLWTDNTGTIRAGRLKDPSNPVGRTVKANFTTVNMLRPIDAQADNPSGLTTLIGARRNWSQFSASDFVTDQAIVSQDRKARYMRPSQYNVTSSQTPAGQYSFAIGAPVFDSVIDIPADAQNEIDATVGIWSPQIYSDGTAITGKRRIVTFTTEWDDPNVLGVTVTCAVTAIGFGDIIQITYPAHNLNGTYGAVLAWEVFPFAQKITLTVLV